MTKRLIEEWLPIAELGEESMRERRSMTALPPIYYLHVWWARRLLVASRAAVLASLLPADADCKSFMDMLGIHGDPVAAKKRIEIAKKKGEKLKGNPYGYARAFQYRPTDTEIEWMRRNLASPSTEPPILLDPTSGGGSIPLESLRLGCKTYANDLNPVAAFVQKATHELPLGMVAPWPQNSRGSRIGLLILSLKSSHAYIQRKSLAPMWLVTYGQERLRVHIAKVSFPCLPSGSLAPTVPGSG